MSEGKEQYIIAMHDAEDQRNHPVFSMFQRPVAFHKIFVDVTGSVTAALMLSQAFYWSKQGRKGYWDGWFFKSADEWEEETGLTRREQETARRKLRKFDWWQEKIAKANGTPTLHYRINARAFFSYLRETQFDKLVKPDSTNCETPVTETTTETTTELATPETTDTPSLSRRVHDTLQGMWMTVNKTQLDNHMELVDRYGFDDWLEGWNLTPVGGRSSQSAVEKFIWKVREKQPAPSVAQEPIYVTNPLTGEREIING